MYKAKSFVLIFLEIFLCLSTVFGDVVFPDIIDGSLFPEPIASPEPPILFYLDTSPLGFDNFGDVISQKLVERMLGQKIQVTNDPFIPQKKLLALGSIIRFAKNGDIVWGAGVNGRRLEKENYHFTHLDIRAVRGPLTKKFLEELGIHCPEIYGDPALLIPKFFPEFKKSPNPTKEYIVIAHFEDEPLLQGIPNLVSVKEKWDEVIKKILDSKFVISTSLHGIIVAEAFGIPARLLIGSGNEPLFKYVDYYYGTKRSSFSYATSIGEALKMGGEVEPECDLEKLCNAFPYEYWHNSDYINQLTNLEDSLHDFVLETKRIEIPGFPFAFNPSIIRWNGRLLLCFRTRNQVSGSTDKIGFMWLDDNFNPTGEPLILQHRIPHPFRSWIHDPRLIKVVEDRYCLVYSNLWKVEMEEVRRVFIAELGYDGTNFYTESPSVLLDFENNTESKEKNWVPFNYQNFLHLSYTIFPHKVMRVISSKCEMIATSSSNIKWDWGEIRGGTPACLVDGEYLAFFHSSKRMATKQSKGVNILHYFMGAYTFNPNPPFEITRFSTEPIKGKDFYSDTFYKTWVPLKVVFPVGCIFEKGFIWVSYGKQDHETWIAKIDKRKLLDSLVSVR